MQTAELVYATFFMAYLNVRCRNVMGIIYVCQVIDRPSHIMFVKHRLAWGRG